MKKIYLILIMLALMIQVNVVAQVTDEDYIYQKDTNNTFKVYCFNNDSGFCDDTVTCQISIQYPNSTDLLNNESMFYGESYFGYNLTAEQLDQYGRYFAFGVCSGSNSLPFDEYFDVTYSGERLTTGQSFLYLGLIAFIIIGMVALLFIIGMLPSQNSRDDNGNLLDINKLKYFRPVLIFVEYLLVVGLLFLASNVAYAYLQNDMFGSFLLIFFKISLLLMPLIILLWFIWFIIQIKEDRELHSYMERGFFKERL